MTEKEVSLENKSLILLPKVTQVSQGSYSSYSSCNGSAVIRLIHREACQAKMTMSREQGRLSDPSSSSLPCVRSARYVSWWQLVSPAVTHTLMEAGTIQTPWEQLSQPFRALWLGIV